MLHTLTSVEGRRNIRNIFMMKLVNWTVLRLKFIDFSSSLSPPITGA
jgi:hypothetical protein